MRTKGMLLAAGLALVAVSGPLEAQARFGVNLSWGSDSDIGLGARVGFGLGELTQRNKIEGQATFDYFFPKGGHIWEVTGNGLYHLNSSGTVAPYLGAGLGYAHAGASSSNYTTTRFATLRPVLSIAQLASGYSAGNFFLNLLGGVRFKPTGNIQPFAEARAEIGSGSQLVLTGGVYFGRK